MSLARTVALLLAVLLALVAAFGTVASAVIRTRDTRIRYLTRQVVPAGSAADDLMTAMINQETGERGYVITGQAGFLDPYQSGLAKAPTDMATLRRLLPQDQAIGPSLDQIESAITIWQQRTATPEINDVMSGNPAAATASVSNGQGKVQFDTVRSKIAALNALLEERRSAAEKSLNHATAVVTDLLYDGLGIAVVVIVITGVLVRRWILIPVGSVSRDMRTVVGGLLNHRIVPPGRPRSRRWPATPMP